MQHHLGLDDCGIRESSTSPQTNPRNVPQGKRVHKNARKISCKQPNRRTEANSGTNRSKFQGGLFLFTKFEERRHTKQRERAIKKCCTTLNTINKVWETRNTSRENGLLCAHSFISSQLRRRLWRLCFSAHSDRVGTPERHFHRKKEHNPYTMSK